MGVSAGKMFIDVDRPSKHLFFLTFLKHARDLSVVAFELEHADFEVLKWCQVRHWPLIYVLK